MLTKDQHVAFALFNTTTAGLLFWYYRKSGKTWAAVLAALQVSGAVWNVYNLNRSA